MDENKSFLISQVDDVRSHYSAMIHASHQIEELWQADISTFMSKDEAEKYNNPTEPPKAPQKKKLQELRNIGEQPVEPIAPTEPEVPEQRSFFQQLNSTTTAKKLFIFSIIGIVLFIVNAIGILKVKAGIFSDFLAALIAGYFVFSAFTLPIVWLVIRKKDKTDYKVAMRTYNEERTKYEKDCKKYQIAKSEYDNDFDFNEKVEKENKEAETYNQSQYFEDCEAYELAKQKYAILKPIEEKEIESYLERARQKQQEGIEDAQKEYDELTAWLNSQQVIPEEYWGEAGTIIKILKNGRADSIKEALNVFEADRKADALVEKQQELIEKQQEYNDILEDNLRRQIAEQERYNAEMVRIENKRIYQEAEELRRHNIETEKIQQRKMEEDRKNADAVAKCSGCPNRQSCFHVGSPGARCWIANH